MRRKSKAILPYFLIESDRIAMHHHFARLSSEDLRLRFGHPPGEQWLSQYVNNIDLESDAVLGVRAGKELLGLTHLALYRGAVELGLSVLPTARHQGIASAMFERAVLHARNRGVVELFMHCLSENQAMRKIARRAGMRLVVEGSETDAFIELTPATIFSIGTEQLACQQVLIDLALRPVEAVGIE